jgi:hypothetical protein
MRIQPDEAGQASRAPAPFVQLKGEAMQKNDLWIAPVLEAALIFVAAITGWATHTPLVFASLGPTAYELIETPERKTARPYNIVVGHLIGILAGFAGLFIAHAWNAPALAAGTIALPRAGASVLAAALTVLFTLLFKASQPAAVATSLLIALGSLQTWEDGFFIMGGVLMMLLLGEPLRVLRLQHRAKETRRQTAGS